MPCWWRGAYSSAACASTLRCPKERLRYRCLRPWPPQEHPAVGSHPSVLNRRTKKITAQRR